MLGDEMIDEASHNSHKMPRAIVARGRAAGNAGRDPGMGSWPVREQMALCGYKRKNRTLIAVIGPELPSC